MSKKTDESYELLTVAELKELADQQGIEIPHDARKADIIEALEEHDDKPSKAGAKEKPEGKDEGDNIYLFNTSSTTEGHMTHDDFWRIKLTA